MNVHELILHLQTLDPKLPVGLLDDGDFLEMTEAVVEEHHPMERYIARDNKGHEFPSYRYAESPSLVVRIS